MGVTVDLTTTAAAVVPAAAPTSARAAVAAARTIVVKVGSSSITTSAGGLDRDRLDRLVDALAARQVAGSHVVLVSSGAIAAGLAPLGLTRRPRDLATQQAAAAVGQQLLAEQYAGSFARFGLTVGQVLLTSDDVVRRAHYRNAQRTLSKLLNFGVVPVVNENDTVATTEIRFGDNDRLAALVAHLVGADALVLLSDVDALYTGDPRLPTSVRVPEVDDSATLAGVEIADSGSDVGTGGMGSKLAAARTATGAGIPVLLASAVDATAALSVHGASGRHRLRGISPAHHLPALLVAPRGAPRRARSPWTRARSRRSRSAASRCCRPGSPATAVISNPVTWSTCVGRTTGLSRAASSATTPPSCRRSSAGRWPIYRPSTAARSCTPTIWWPCDLDPRTRPPVWRKPS